MVTAKKRTTTARKKPGSTGKGDYYHIELLPKTGFVSFRTQDVGDPGHIQRVAGKRASGSWATVKWLVGKKDAHVRGENLVPDSKDAKELIKQLGVKPVHVSGDRFKAKTTDKPLARAKNARGTKTQTKGRER